MECFYTEKLGLLSKEEKKNFEIFQATAYTWWGDYSKLTEIYQSEIIKKIEHKNKLRAKHQEKVGLIKYAQKSQSSLGEAPETSLKTVEKVQAVNANVSSDAVMSEVTYEEEQQRRKKEAEDRIRRHQEAKIERQQKNILTQDVDSREEEHSSSQIEQLRKKSVDPANLKDTSANHFSLTTKTYDIIARMFANNWKITRVEIENIFEELGQTINTQTKSSHHIIKLSQAIALVDKDAQIIGVITDLSAQAGGHLTLPDWGKIVPIYMRSQILNLLQLIGINQGNYSKASAEGRTQYIPVQTNSSVSQANTQNQPTTSRKKNKRKKKGNPNSQSDKL